MPVIMKDNVQYAYTTKGTVFHTLSNAEYEALTEEEKMNGDVYCIPDREPVINPDQLWEKVGTDTLDTTAQDLSGAVNELNSSLTNLFKTATISKASSNSNYISTGISAVDNIVLSAYETSGAQGVVVNMGRTGNAVWLYFYSANGNPYTGACTIEVHYVQK